MRACECEASGKLRPLSDFNSSGIAPSVSQIMSSIGDGASYVTRMSRFEQFWLGHIHEAQDIL